MATRHTYQLSDHFKARYEPVTESGCWLWTGSTDPRGYGRIWLSRGKHLKAHRASYELHVGPIPAGMSVCHKCDTPSCVNPDHLYAGTHRENMQDMSRRGRRRKDRTTAKLTVEQVVELKRMLSDGSESQTAIAKKFGVSQSNVSNIHRGASWAGVSA